MANKRKYADPTPDLSIYSKRSRFFDTGDDSPNGNSTAQPRVDPTYGQRGAFPGLDDEDGENDLFYGPASDGLEYLRMVRSEAKTVPNLLVAPISHTVGDAKLYADYSDGYYADGAYTAAPIQPVCPQPDNESQDANPQEAYYASLCARFSALATTLRSPSPALNTAAQTFSSATHRTWRYKLLYTQPTMTLLSQLPQDSVVHGLNMLETLLTKNNLAKGKELGTWGWGLLARCRPVGEMGSEEVGILRSLGKKAVWQLRGMMAGREDDAWAEEEVDDLVNEEAERDSAVGLGKVQSDRDRDLVPETEEFVEDILKPPDAIQANLIPNATPTPNTSSMDRPELSQGQLETASNTSDALDQAKQLLLSSLTRSSSPIVTSYTSKKSISKPSEEIAGEEPPPAVPEAQSSKEQENDENPDICIYATLDMIITIVGEFYGQRDLLNGRMLWDEM